MSKIARRAFVLFVLLQQMATFSNAQVRGLGEVGGGLGSAVTAGVVITTPTMPSFNTNTDLKSLQDFSPPPIAGTATPAPATPLGAASIAPAQATPLLHAPLLSAYARTEDESTHCDISAASRQACDGPNCLLSCAVDVCPNQESTSCEFMIDCAAEIASEVISGDQQCDESTIEHTTVSTDNGVVKVNTVRIAAGTSCKPPPCLN